MAKNLRTKNGIIHVVHDAFFPPIGNIMDILWNDPDYTSFVHAIQLTGMQQIMQNGKLILLLVQSLYFTLIRRLMGSLNHELRR
jgi:hypothetical protein